MVKSAKVEPKKMSEPHMAAIFGIMSCGNIAVIITMNPKLDMPWIQIKL